MPETFLKLLNMSISASWIVLAVLLLRVLMKKVPKWITCALWAMVALRLVMPFSIESMFSLIPESIIRGEVVAEIADDYWGTTHIYHDNTDEFQIAVDAGRQPIYSGEGHYYVVTAEDGISEPPTFENTIVPVLSGIWIAGMAAMAVYAAVSYLLIRRKISASVYLRENIYLCDYIDTPFILGIIRPRIYLPSTLDQCNWPHVVAHEQAHLKRRDHWWKPLGFTLLCLHWFNPLLWLAYILLCRDIELACDEKVIRDMNGQDKQAYSEALLECSMPRYLIAACPLAFGEVGVKDRVKSILNYKKPAFWVVLIALILCIIAAVGFLTDPMGSRTVVPGMYTYDRDIYEELYYDGVSRPVVPAGVYTLDQNNVLYRHYDGQVNAVGTMERYHLDIGELSGYLKDDDAWQVLFHQLPMATDALWLRMEDQSFYLLFKTTDGSTYLARGWEDYGERNTESDDTRITHLCQFIHRPGSVQESMTYLVGTVTEVHDTSILMQTDENALFPYRVSLYRFSYDAATNIAATGIMPAPETGALVLVTFDGNIVRQNGEYYIPNVRGIRVLEGAGADCAALSANDEVTPLILPNGTDISAIDHSIPMLKLYQENGNQFNLLYEDIQLSGGFRLYDYHTREEIKGFSSLTEGTNWDLLAPGRNYIVTADYNGLILFAVSVPHDFGITLTARNVSPTGVTIDCVQSGGTCRGPFTYGEAYTLQKYNGERWVPVMNLNGNYTNTFFTVAYMLKQNETTSWRFNWQSIYGELEPGEYRLVRYFSYGDALSQDYHYLPFYAEFTIS